MERIRDFWEFSVSDLRKSKILIKKQKVCGRKFYLKAILKNKMVSFGINAEFPFKAIGIFKIDNKSEIKPNLMRELDCNSYNMIHVNRLKNICRLNYDFNMYFESKERRRHLSRNSFHSNKLSDFEVDFGQTTEIFCRECRKLRIDWSISIAQLLESDFHQTEKFALLEIADIHWWLELRRNDPHCFLSFHVENPFAKIFGYFKTNLDPSDYKFDPEFRLPNGTSGISSLLVISSEKLFDEKSGILGLSLRIEVEINDTAAEDCQLLPLPSIKQKIAVFGISKNGNVELVEHMSKNDPVYQFFLQSNSVISSNEGLILHYSVWTISNVLYLIRMGTLIPTAAKEYNYDEIIRFISKFEIKAAEEPLLNHFRTILRNDNPPLANQSHLSSKVSQSKVKVFEPSCMTFSIKQETV